MINDTAQTDSKADDFVMPDRVCCGAVRCILAGDMTALLGAFVWASSLQGQGHWSDIYCGEKSLTDNDRAYLNEILDRAEKGEF